MLTTESFVMPRGNISASWLNDIADINVWMELASSKIAVLASTQSLIFREKATEYLTYVIGFKQLSDALKATPVEATEGKVSRRFELSQLEQFEKMLNDYIALYLEWLASAGLTDSDWHVVKGGPSVSSKLGRGW